MTSVVSAAVAPTDIVSRLSHVSGMSHLYTHATHMWHQQAACVLTLSIVIDVAIDVALSVYYKVTCFAVYYTNNSNTNNTKTIEARRHTAAVKAAHHICSGSHGIYNKNKQNQRNPIYKPYVQISLSMHLCNSMELKVFSPPYSPKRTIHNELWLTPGNTT